MSWSWYKDLTIDSALVPSTQSNFTVTVKGTDNDMRTIANGGLLTTVDEVAFYADNTLASLLGFTRVYHNGTTGDFEYKVKVASVTTGADATFTMAYVDSGVVASLENKTNAWDANYLVVHAYGDGSAFNGTDSTANGHTLTNAGAAPLTASTDGNGGGAAVGTASGYAEKTSSVPTFAGLGTGTLEAYFKAPTLANHTLIDLGGTSTTASRLELRSNGAVRAIAFWNTGSITFAESAASAITANVWSYAAASYVSRSQRYVKANTSARVSDTGDSGTYNTPTILTVAARNIAGTRGQFCNTDLIGETRISNVTRSDDWCTTVANSLVNCATFISFGAKTAVGGGGVLLRPYMMGA
jgi:hypothetical protein